MSKKNAEVKAGDELILEVPKRFSERRKGPNYRGPRVAIKCFVAGVSPTAISIAPVDPDCDEVVLDSYFALTDEGNLLCLNAEEVKWQADIYDWLYKAIQRGRVICGKDFNTLQNRLSGTKKRSNSSTSCAFA